MNFLLIVFISRVSHRPWCGRILNRSLLDRKVLSSADNLLHLSVKTLEWNLLDFLLGYELHVRVLTHAQGYGEALGLMHEGLG